MAELACGPYVSILPYAWFAPSLYRHKQASENELRVEANDGFSLTRPLRVGLDVWIYPFGAASSTHFSASIIASLVDNSGNGAQETAVVVGWTF
jgi:MarR-like DNA-binding transcriptional regulator SgrR of sgrS sRNA